MPQPDTRHGKVDEIIPPAKIRNFLFSGRFILPASIFLFALGVRLVITFELARNSPFFEQPIIDAWRYDQLARALTSSWKWPESTAFLQPPGYPYFLAAVYRIFDGSYLWARVVQAVIGACTCVLIADLARHFTGKYWLGWFGGLCAAVYGPLIYFELDLLSTGLNLFLTVIGLRLFLCFLDSGKTFYLFFAGLFYGLAVICWPLTGTLAVGTMVCIALRSRQKPFQAAKQIVLAGLGLSLVILPLTLHNYRAGSPALIASEGSMGLYIGNNPDWLNTTMVSPGYQWERLLTLPYRVYGPEEVRKTGTSALFYREVKSYLMEHPWQYVRAQLTKVYQLVNGYEIMNPTDPYFFKQYSSFLNTLIFRCGWLQFPFGLLFPLALIGMVFGSRQGKREDVTLLFVHLTAAVLGLLLFFISSRYRLFLLPFLIIFAALGLEQVARIKTTVGKRAVWLILVGILGYLVSNSDLLALQKYYARPEVRSQPYFALGRILIRQGSYREAMPPLREAVNIHPGYADAWVDLGRARFMTGDKAGALEAMLTASRATPDYSLPYYNLARLYDEPDGSIEKARYYYSAYLDVAGKNYVSSISGSNQQRLHTVTRRLQQLKAR